MLPTFIWWQYIARLLARPSVEPLNFGPKNRNAHSACTFYFIQSNLNPRPFSFSPSPEHRLSISPTMHTITLCSGKPEKLK